MSYQITVQPASEPITTDEAKTQLRVDFSDEDGFIDDLITASRKFCEHYTNRVFITQTWRQNESQWTQPICLKVNPVISVTTLKYYDTNNTQQTITDDTDNYQVDLLSDTAAIYEGIVNGFPSISGSKINPIEVMMVCGYGAASAVPEDIKNAIKIMVSFFYEHRDLVNVPVTSAATQIPIPKAVYSLLAPYRVNVFG